MRVRVRVEPNVARSIILSSTARRLCVAELPLACASIVLIIDFALVLIKLICKTRTTARASKGRACDLDYYHYELSAQAVGSLTGKAAAAAPTVARRVVGRLAHSQQLAGKLRQQIDCAPAAWSARACAPMGLLRARNKQTNDDDDADDKTSPLLFVHLCEPSLARSHLPVAVATKTATVDRINGTSFSAKTTTTTERTRAQQPLVAARSAPLPHLLRVCVPARLVRRRRRRLGLAEVGRSLG